MKKPAGFTLIPLLCGMLIFVSGQCRRRGAKAHDFQQNGVLRLIDHLESKNVESTPFADILSQFAGVEEELAGPVSLIPELSTARQKVWAATTRKSILGNSNSEAPPGMEIRIQGEPILYMEEADPDEVRWKWIDTDSIIDMSTHANYRRNLKRLVLEAEDFFSFDVILPDAPVEFEISTRRLRRPLALALYIDDRYVDRIPLQMDAEAIRFSLQESPGYHTITLRPYVREVRREFASLVPRIQIFQIRIKTRNDLILFSVPFEKQRGFSGSKLSAYYLTDQDESGDVTPEAAIFRAREMFVPDETSQPVNPENIKKKLPLENLSLDVLMAPAPSRFSFDLDIPVSGVLEFGTGIFVFPEHGSGQNALFRVTVEKHGAQKVVFERNHTLSQDLLRDQIQETRIDLSAWAGQHIRLILSTESSPNQDPSRPASPAPGFAFWSNPILYQSSDHAIEAPNVILISLDTLRADHLGCYGYQRDTSPHIDTLAEDAALFERTYAQSSWTLPSHMSMLFSLNTASHQVYFNDQKIDSSLPSLATHLRKKGYVTHGITGGGYVSGIYGFDKDFDWYEEPVPGSTAQNGQDEVKQLWSKTSDWMDRHFNKPFFLFLHTFQIHGPYASPAPYNRMYLEKDAVWDSIRLVDFLNENGEDYPFSDEEQANILGLYDGEIRYTDDFLIRQLTAKLRELRIYDNTLLIITSDHGEEFNDHGGWLHGRNLYDELLRVPLIIKFPNSAHRGQRVNSLCRIIDILPTVLDVAGIPFDRNSIEGRSLMDFLSGNEGEDRQFISDLAYKNVPEPCPAQIATNSNSLKFIIKKTADGIKDVETYDLRRDPQEKNNIFTRTQKLKDQVIHFLDAYYKERAKLVRKQERISIDKELEEKLKALGYLR